MIYTQIRQKIIHRFIQNKQSRTGTRTHNQQLERNTHDLTGKLLFNFVLFFVSTFRKVGDVEDDEAVTEKNRCEYWIKKEIWSTKKTVFLIEGQMKRKERENC